MKFALWGLVICVVVMWLMRPKKTSAREDQTTHTKAQSSHEVERMVQCSHCGTYVPASEAVPGAHTMFCSEEHRRQHGSM